MKNLRTSIVGIVTGAMLVAVAQAEDKVQLDGAKAGHWTMDYDAATKLAAEKELPMLLNFTGSDWCGWCKLMDKNVFAEKDWKKFAADNVILVTIDFPKDKSIVPEKFVDRNKELQKKFGVRGYPTYIILESDGETKLGQLGAGKDKTPESFIEEFKGVVRMSDASVEAFCKAHPDKAEAYKEALAGVKSAEKELKDWIETKPERNEENQKKFEGFRKSIEAANAKLAEFDA